MSDKRTRELDPEKAKEFSEYFKPSKGQTELTDSVKGAWESMKGLLSDNSGDAMGEAIARRSKKVGS